MLTSRGHGSHDLKAGFENFVKNRYVGGNSQTATGYVFRADYEPRRAAVPCSMKQSHVIPR